jgi:tripartite-type tricarboxylate transporter receptor subunit TctC
MNSFPDFFNKLFLLSYFFVFFNAYAVEQFPVHPVKILVGFASGGTADVVARILSPKMSDLLKQNVIIETHAGAGGNIATEQLLHSQPDGYTIMLGTIGSIAVNQHLNKLTYDPVTDIQAISMATVFSNVLVVNSNSNIKNLTDYIKAGKMQSSSLSFGSSGIGSAGHLAGESFKIIAALNIQHIAYRGGAPAMNDLLGGVLPSIFSSPSDALQFIQSGKLQAIAVTGSSRLDVLPNVPTISELGFPGFEAVNWYAFAAPLKTPLEISSRLNEVIVLTLKDPSISLQLKKLGLSPYPTSIDETSKYFRSESDKWGSIIKKSGIKAE